MKAGGSNAKGGAFERLICRMLTKWITGKEHPEIFWRSATSGAKATQDRKQSRQSNQDGDIVAHEPEGKWFTNLFSIECKFRKSYGRLEQLLEQKGKLMEWWDQCCRDAQRSKREPLLIFRQNVSPIIYVMHKSGNVNDDVALPLEYIDICHRGDSGAILVISRLNDWLYINGRRGSSEGLQRQRNQENHDD